MNNSKSKSQIANEALKLKGGLSLNPPTSFLGYKGFEKFICDLHKWKVKLSKYDYDKILEIWLCF